MQEFSKTPPLSEIKINTEAPKEIEIDPKLAARVVFWSFYFSQGNVDLQAKIFAYIANKHADWKLHSRESQKIATSLSRTRVLEFISKGPHRRGWLSFFPLRTIAQVFHSDENAVRCSMFFNALNDRYISLLGRPKDFSVSLFTTEGLLDFIIDRDREFIKKRRVRDEKSTANRAASKKGPHREYMSQFVSYIVAGEPLPKEMPPVYAEMIADLREVFTKKMANKPLEEFTSKVYELIEFHNKHNPDNLVMFPHAAI